MWSAWQAQVYCITTSVRANKCECIGNSKCLTSTCVAWQWAWGKCVKLGFSFMFQHTLGQEWHQCRVHLHCHTHCHHHAGTQHRQQWCQVSHVPIHCLIGILRPHFAGIPVCTFWMWMVSVCGWYIVVGVVEIGSIVSDSSRSKTNIFHLSHVSWWRRSKWIREIHNNFTI
jgi:hypothetical protein